MSKILVTGANGFIGRNLCEYFKDKYTLLIPSHKQLNLLDTNKVDEYLNRHKAEYIIHCANIGGVRDKRKINDVVSLNLRMFFNVVKQIKKTKKIIYFGSGAEYDKSVPIKNITEEEFGKSIPIDDYGFYKYVGSKFTENLSSNKISCLRLFGVYGKYENYLIRFISNSILKNLLHLPIAVNQNSIFDYLFINDLKKIVEYFLSNPCKFNIYNVVPDKKTTLLGIAKIINSISSYQSKIIFKNKGFNNEYTASNDRLHSEIKNLQFTSIRDGIKNLFLWYKKNINTINTKKIRRDEYIKYCAVREF